MATKTQKERKASGKAQKTLEKLNAKLSTTNPEPTLINVGPSLPPANVDFKHMPANDSQVVPISLFDIRSNSQNPRESAPNLIAYGYGIFHKIEGSDKSPVVALALSEKEDDRAEYVKLVDKFDEGIKTLALNLRVIGQRQPVSVRPIEGGYDLIFGCRRFLAALYNYCDKWDKDDSTAATVRALIVNETDERARLVSLSENLHRLQMNPMEQARIYRDMRSQDFSVQEIADLTNVDHQVVRQRLQLLKLPTTEQTKVEEGELGVVKALKLIKGEKKGGTKGSTTGKGHTGDGGRRRAPSIKDLQLMYEEQEPGGKYTEQVREWIAELIDVHYLPWKQLQKEKEKEAKAQEEAASRNNEK